MFIHLGSIATASASVNASRLFNPDSVGGFIDLGVPDPLAMRNVSISRLTCDVFVCRVNNLVSRSVRALEARTCSSGYFLSWTQFVFFVKPRADFVALVRSFPGQVFKFVSN